MIRLIKFLNFKCSIAGLLCNSDSQGKHKNINISAHSAKREHNVERTTFKRKFSISTAAATFVNYMNRNFFIAWDSFRLVFSETCD